VLKLIFVILFVSIPVMAGKYVVLYSDLGESKNDKLSIMFRQIGDQLSANYGYEVSKEQANEDFLRSPDSLKVLMNNNAAERVAAVSINALDSKVFYNVLIVDKSDSGKVSAYRFTAMVYDDFEVIINRLTKMLGLNTTWESTISMDDITRRDAQKRPQRNFSRTAFYLLTGVMTPIGESLRRQPRWTWGDTSTIQPERFITFGLGVIYDLKKYFFEADYSILGFSGMTFGLGGGYFLRDASIAPYVGASLSVTWLYNTVPPQNALAPDTSNYDYYYDYDTYEYTDDVGFGFMPRLGVKFLRDQSFQPFVELAAPIVIGSKRVEKVFGGRFGFSYAF
jgi:hypothetical protein